MSYLHDMDDSNAAQEMANLKSIYEDIADEFSDTREKSWPEFKVVDKYVGEGKRVLDLGCGNGRLYNFLKSKKIDYTGIDFCSRFITLAQERYPKVDFIEQDVTDIEYEGEFDVVTSIALLGHLPTVTVRREFIERAYHALKYDGYFIFTTWNLSLLRFWNYHLAAWLRVITSQGRYGARDLFIPFGKNKAMRYYYAITFSEISKLMTDAGFTIVEKYRKYEGRDNFVFVGQKKALQTVQEPALLPEYDKKFAKDPEPAF